MKKLIIVLFIILLPSFCFANPLQFAWQSTETDNWILADTLIQSTFVTLMAIDWKQTDKLMRIKESITWEEELYDENGIYIGYITKKHTQYKYKEAGLIAKHLIGEHPSRKNIAIYCSSWIIGHSLISYILPRPLRELWQAGGIGVELYCVANNYATEVKFGFNF